MNGILYIYCNAAVGSMNIMSMCKKKILNSWLLLSTLCILIIIAISLSIYFKTDFEECYSSLPMRFEKNDGQTRKQIDFLCRAKNHTVLLSSTGVLLSVPDSKSKALKSARLLQMRLVGANAKAEVKGLDRLVTKSNYFIGNDPGKWRVDIPNYERVKYSEVYAGIDLEYYGNQGKLEYDFIISPGSEPNVISLQFKGMDSIHMNEKGELILSAAFSELTIQEPIAYQERGGIRERVPASYIFQRENQVGFSVGDYDPTLPLVIDPVLAYSTYLGGSGSEGGRAIAVDSFGNTYITGDAGWGGGNFNPEYGCIRVSDPDLFNQCFIKLEYLPGCSVMIPSCDIVSHKNDNSLELLWLDDPVSIMVIIGHFSSPVTTLHHTIRCQVGMYTVPQPYT